MYSHQLYILDLTGTTYLYGVRTDGRTDEYSIQVQIEQRSQPCVTAVPDVAVRPWSFQDLPFHPRRHNSGNFGIFFLHSNN